jgi:hypothetical protein
MIQTKFYFDNIWKQKLWQKNVPKTRVEQTEGNGKSTPIYTPLGT